jgi:hypothetical protein
MKFNSFVYFSIARLRIILKCNAYDGTLVDRRLFDEFLFFFTLSLTDIVPTRMIVGTYVLHSR